MLEQLIVDQFKNTYGTFQPVRLSGGYTNATFLLDGTNPLVVVKVAHRSNIDIKNEFTSLTLLQHFSSIPNVKEYVELEKHVLLVMDYRQGRNGQSILDDNDLVLMKQLYEQLGKTLATDIHTIKYRRQHQHIKDCTLENIDFDLSFVPIELVTKSKIVLNGITDQKNEWVLTHGDYGIHNVLLDKTNRLTILDWEWAEWANPLTDIAWVCWFTRLHYPNVAKLLNPIFLDSYIKNSDIHITTKEMNAYCLYRVWNVLQKVQTGSFEAQNEWVKRLRWTFDTDIFDFISNQST